MFVILKTKADEVIQVFNQGKLVTTIQHPSIFKDRDLYWWFENNQTVEPTEKGVHYVKFNEEIFLGDEFIWDNLSQNVYVSDDIRYVEKMMNNTLTDEKDLIETAIDIRQQCLG